MFVSFESSPSAGPSALGIARGLPTLRRILRPHSYDLLTVDVFYSISATGTSRDNDRNSSTTTSQSSFTQDRYILFAWVNFLTCTSLVAFQLFTSAFSVVFSSSSS